MNAPDQATSQGGDIRIETVDRYDAWRLLTEAAAADGIARVVWSSEGGPAVVPVNFTVADGSLWFQVATGSRLARECDGQRVVVEVDRAEPASHTGWSVIVTGAATTMPASEDPGLLAGLQVWPGGERQQLLQVEPIEITGRRLRHR